MYLELLAKHAEQEQLDVIGYCLMNNHVHLVLVPRQREALARALRRAHGEYAQHLNQTRGRIGHLWQNRYYSCVMDERHLWVALRYVERNPVRAGMVAVAWQWRWSSAPDHAGERTQEPVPLRKQEWAAAFGVTDWRQSLTWEEDAEEAVLRAYTRAGWAMGSVEFCLELERKLGCPVRPRPEGRPPRAAERAGSMTAVAPGTR